MMLQALIAYADRNNLGGDASLTNVEVRWAIYIDKSGKLSSLIPLFEDVEEKRPKPKKLLRPFTSANDLNQGDKSHFLCDTLERSVLFFDGKTPQKEDGRRVQHVYFQSLLKEAAAFCPAEAARLNAVLTFLNNLDSLDQLHAKLRADKAKPNDNATFFVDGVNLLEPNILNALIPFWRKKQEAKEIPDDPRERRICVATGELAETLDTTEKIKGVPGGMSVGTNLISFDKDSFCSFGLEQAQNAALSAPAELKIRSALNQLITQSRKQGLVFNNTIYLHWTRKPLDFDPTDLLSSADKNGIEQLLKSVEDGKRVLGLEENAYYATSLSGNGARIVVRDWLESTVPEVERHLAEWFRDLGIIDRDGSRVKFDFKLYSLLHSLVRAGLDELPPALPTQLFHGALVGRSVPLPQIALAAALRRQQLDQENKLNTARMALIKACLIRSPNRKETNTMTEKLDPESKDSAYLCGRLFAVFDRLQYLAQGGVNAGVVDRYYASASVTPSLVMGRLFRNAQFHLAKIGGGVATNVTKDFETLSEALGATFPTVLDLEAQGRFALGYYHQKAEYRHRSEERKEAETLAESTTT